MQNYLNLQNNQGDQGEADTKRKRSEFQREMIMLEDERRHKEIEKTRTETEIRVFKKDLARAKAEIQEKQTMLQKIDQEIFGIDGEIKSLKKKMNLL